MPIKNTIIQGDCLEVLKTFPDESVNCVITSPPYFALRDYGTGSWRGGAPDCDHKMPRNVNRAKPGDKQLPASAADVWTTCGKCGAVKEDKQIGIETNHKEYVKKLCDIFDEIKRVLTKDGTCWVNLGDTYSAQRWSDNKVTSFMSRGKNAGKNYVIKKETGLPDKCLVQIPSRFAIEMTDRGWILRNEIIWHKPNCMPASVRDRFTVDFEKIFFFTKSQKYNFETQYEPTKCNEKYQHGTFGRKSLAGKEGVKIKLDPRGRNKRAVWQVTTRPFKEAHFATFPETLIETPIKAGCPKDGIVLDPFMGAGTTAVVAKKLGRDYIGIELNPEYIKIAEKRIANIPKLLF